MADHYSPEDRERAALVAELAGRETARLIRELPDDQLSEVLAGQGSFTLVRATEDGRDDEQ